MESGGLPPESFVEVMPLRTSENILVQNRMSLFSSLIFKGGAPLLEAKSLIRCRNRFIHEYWLIVRVVEVLKFADWFKQWQRLALSMMG